VDLDLDLAIGGLITSLQLREYNNNCIIILIVVFYTLCEFVLFMPKGY